MNKARLDELVGEATVDCDDEDEAVSGFATMMEEHLRLPFTTHILGVEVVVDEVGQGRGGRIIARCVRGRHRQPVDLLDLPLPTPPPAGAEWIEAYRHWCGPA